MHPVDGRPRVQAATACPLWPRPTPPSGGLTLTALPTDFARHRGNAEEWRDERLVSIADAAVLVGDPTQVRRLLELAARKGLRVAWVGGPARQAEVPEASRAEVPRFGNLPD